MLKLHDSIWIISDSMMQPCQEDFFPIKEAANLGGGKQMMYDFFLHLLKSFEIEETVFPVKIADLNAYYKIDLISVCKRELLEGLSALIPFPWDLDVRFYPRMLVGREVTTLPALDFDKISCNCGRPNRSLKNGAYGMHVSCASCRKNTPLSKFIA